MIQLYPNGGKLFQMSPAPTREQPKRGKCKGWTREASRGNTDFLLSVYAPDLTGHGYALSLTVRTCPETPQDWQRLRTNFVKRLRRAGLVRLHWLTEWQRRGVPHMHAAVWFDDVINPGSIIEHWRESAVDYGPGILSQHVAPITGAPGWFEYLAKHGARSVHNYQRSPENIPSSWGGNTGRMWGHLGSWPRSEGKNIEASEPVELQYRRLMIRYQIGKAKRQGDRDRVRYLRRYLSKAPKETSKAAALPRLWIPEEDQWSLLRCAYGSHAPE